MCKAVDRGMIVTTIRLFHKSAVNQVFTRLRDAFGGRSAPPFPGAAQAARPEQVSVGDGLGRVLAEDVVSRRTQPPFAVSAMDGYAARAVDVASVPARLRVVGAAPAGGASRAGSAPAKPFASSPAPGCRQRRLHRHQEDTTRAGDWVTVRRAPLPATISGPKGSISGPAIAGSPPELC